MIVIIAAFTILATGTALIVIPVSPSISGTFLIYNGQGSFAVSEISAIYSKQPFIKGVLSNQSLSLPVQPATGGPYAINITITYNGARLANQLYYQMGLGTYTFQITWSPFNRQEMPGVAYYLFVSVSGTNGVTNGFSSSVAPS